MPLSSPGEAVGIDFMIVWSIFAEKTLRSFFPLFIRVCSARKTISYKKIFSIFSFYLKETSNATSVRKGIFF